MGEHVMPFRRIEMMIDWFALLGIGVMIGVWEFLEWLDLHKSKVNPELVVPKSSTNVSTGGES